MAKHVTHPTVYQLEDVFTPSAPAILTFVDRGNHAVIESYMKEHSRPICLEGPFQAGKTCLIDRVSKTVFPNGAIHVVCKRESTVESLVRTAFQILQPYYHSEVMREKSRVPHTFTQSLFASVTQDGNDEAAVSKVTRPAIELTSSVLAMFAADAARPLVIDDAQKLNECERQKLADIMREWQTQITQYGHPKIVVIASDLRAGSMSRSLLKSAPDLSNRLVSVRLPRMTADELGLIIRRGGKLLNVDFSAVEDYILSLSGGRAGPGRPGYVHDLCRHACLAAGVAQTLPAARAITAVQFEEALKIWSTNAAPSIQIKFEEFFDSPPEGVNRGFCVQLCTLLSESGFFGLSLAELIERLSEEFSLSIDKCSAAIDALVSEADGVVVLEQTTQHVTFAEPLYLAYFDKAKEMPLDYFAAQDLAKCVVEIMKRS